MSVTDFEISKIIAERFIELKKDKRDVRSCALNRVVDVVSMEELREIIKVDVLFAEPMKDRLIGTAVNSIIKSLAYQGLYNMIVDEIGPKGFEKLAKGYTFRPKDDAMVLNKRRSNELMMMRIWKDMNMNKLGAKHLTQSIRSIRSAKFKAKADTFYKSVMTIDAVIGEIIECLPAVFDYIKIETFRKKGNKFDGRYITVVKPVRDTAISTISASPIPTYQNIIDANINGGTIAEKALSILSDTMYAVDVPYFIALKTLATDPLFEKLIAEDSIDKAEIAAKVGAIRCGMANMEYQIGSLGSHRFYSMWKVDFRGRIYMLSPASFVTSKCTKSILRAGEKVALGSEGLYWLTIGLAGSFGFDKLSFEDRYKEGRALVDKCTAIGQRILQNPVEGFRALADAKPDNLFEAGSYCVELYRLSQFGGKTEEFMTDLFIQLDCTNSGVQIQSLLMHGELLSNYTNCNRRPGDDAAAEDLYRRCADEMTEMVNADPKANDNAKLFAGLAAGKKRKMMKYLVMRGAYGARFPNLSDAVAGEAKVLFDHDEDKALLFGQDVVRLYNRLLAESDTFKALKRYKDFAWNVAKAFAQADKFMDITLPMDIEGYKPQRIVCRYEKVEGKKRYMLINGSSKVIYVYTDQDLLECNRKVRRVIDTEKMKNAAAPNCIHALDAMLLQMVVIAMEGTSVAVTHDCYGVVPSKVAEMRAAFTDALVKMFADNSDFIAKLIDQVEEATGIRVDNPCDEDTSWIRPGLMNQTHAIC